jgi:PiT family inorganic phosphate transporter
MGLIMLILIGTVPTAYALNKAVDNKHVDAFVATSAKAIQVLEHASNGAVPSVAPEKDVMEFVRTRTAAPSTLSAMAQLAAKVSSEVKNYGSLANVPPEQVGNVRNDMYLMSESLRLIGKKATPSFSVEDKATLKTYSRGLDDGTKFIPPWVKVAVALALGLGTMVGWKRIVVTVGEKIGKSHLTYAQGASAEVVAMATIGAADAFGLPVSTTHVLSSGVAGTMAANKSGLQGATVRNLLMAWVLTLPASIALAGLLYWFFRSLFVH